MRNRTKIFGLLSASVALALATWFALPAAPEARWGRAAHETRASTSATTSPALRAELAGEAAADPDAVLGPGAIDARRVPDAPALRGRLLDATTGLPLAGRTIELRARVDAPFVAGPAAMPAPAHRSAAVFAALLGRIAEGKPVSRELSDVAAEPPSPVGVLDRSVEVAVHVEPVAPLAPPQSEPAAPDAPRVSYVVEDFDVELAQSTSIAPVGLVRRVVAGSDGQPLTELDFGSLRLQASSIRFTLTDGARAGPLQLDLPSVPTAGWLPSTPRPLPLSFLVPATWKGLGEAVTDAEGRFEFECPTLSARALELRLVTTEEEWCADADLALAAEHACEDEVEWRVELAAGAVVRGRLLDASTRARSRT
ncbi:MAG: hypothetical protein IPJ77_21020 [Planctomycetes bacterium]|nr:hypothetical protein [Planctomycetota bacterium]